MSDEKQFKAAVQKPAEIDSISLIVSFDVNNHVPGLQGTSFQSMSYTVPAFQNGFDGEHHDAPERFSAGSVGSLKARLRSGVSDSAFLRDSSGDV
jgi:hypothetical protein